MLRLTFSRAGLFLIVLSICNCASVERPMLDTDKIITEGKINCHIEGVIVEPELHEDQGLIKSVKDFNAKPDKENRVNQISGMYPESLSGVTNPYNHWKLSLEEILRDPDLFDFDNVDKMSLRVDVLEIRFPNSMKVIDIIAHYKIVDAGDMEVVFSEDIQTRTENVQRKGAILKAINENIGMFIEELAKIQG